VRYPTRDLLRCLRRKAKGTDFWLPDLTAGEAWRLTEFLDEIQEAIWMEYGNAISDYLDSRNCRPPPQEVRAETIPAPVDVEFRSPRAPEYRGTFMPLSTSLGRSLQESLGNNSWSAGLQRPS